MRGDSERRRRWIGALGLASAILLLLAAETILKGWLSPVAVLAVYLFCTMLTALAVVIAVLDARAVAKRTWQEQRHLLDETLREIQREKASAKAAPPSRPSSPT
jgi:cell division protein FtsL